jgi:3-hydroxyacyl-[acyl-carrier-protein] dehydratase
MTAEENEQDVPDIVEIDVNRIKELIPHRYPFLMIDKIRSIEFDKRAIGIKNVTVNEPHFDGHFPNLPVMPGVLIIEAMAQTAGCLVVATLGAESEGKLVYFMTVENAKFRKTVVPGDQLEIDVQKQRRRGPVWKFSGKAYVGGALAAEAVFSAMIVDS